jgi:hypothetical protein
MCKWGELRRKMKIMEKGAAEAQAKVLKTNLTMESMASNMGGTIIGGS